MMVRHTIKILQQMLQCYKIFILCLTILRHDALTPSWRRSLLYRNQSINLLSKSMDLFLYNRDLRHERAKDNTFQQKYSTATDSSCLKQRSYLIPGLIPSALGSENFSSYARSNAPSLCPRNVSSLLFFVTVHISILFNWATSKIELKKLII